MHTCSPISIAINVNATGATNLSKAVYGPLQQVLAPFLSTSTSMAAKVRCEMRCGNFLHLNEACDENEMKSKKGAKREL